MTEGWVVVLDADDFAMAGSLFGLGVEALQDDQRWWLRGRAHDDETRQRLLHVAAAARFMIGREGRLVPLGGMAPTETLPTGDWRPLEECLRLKSTVPMLAGELTARFPLKLVQDDSLSVMMRTPFALLVESSRWARYAESASAIRLSPLSFAADADRALILGKPLPPLPGTRLANVEDVLLPLGMRWEPPLPGAEVRKLIGHSHEEFALWLPDPAIEAIPKSAFVAASRSAVRLTVGGGDG
jgi:hypothetical protein